MEGLKPANKIGASFGSYGWKNTITKMLNEKLQQMKVELIDEGISVQYVPTEEELKSCFALGQKVKEKVVIG